MPDLLKFSWDTTFIHSANGMMHTQLTEEYAKYLKATSQVFAKKYNLHFSDGRLMSKREPYIPRVTPPPLPKKKK